MRARLLAQEIFIASIHYQCVAISAVSKSVLLSILIISVRLTLILTPPSPHCYKLDLVCRQDSMPASPLLPRHQLFTKAFTAPRYAIGVFPCGAAVEVQRIFAVAPRCCAIAKAT